MGRWVQAAAIAWLCCACVLPAHAGDAEAFIREAQALAKQGAHAEAAERFEAYLKEHPKGKSVFAAHAGAFDGWRQAGDEKRARKAGLRIFKAYPDAKGTYPVLWHWIDQGWKVPKLATSYKALHYWTFSRVPASSQPDKRLAFLELIERFHKKSDLIKDKGILYCKAWAHMTAGRADEAVELGGTYLRAKPKGDYADRTRLVMAQAYLQASPPDADAAGKLLKVVASNDKSPQQAAAKDLLLRAGTGPAPIQIDVAKGFPTRAGLGQVVMLTNLPTSHPYRAVLGTWQTSREAEVVSFRGRDVGKAAKALRSHGAEFVAVVVEPDTLDNDFHLEMLELCRGLDGDPMPDFHFGYLTARDADDLAALAARILDKDATGGRVARDIGMPRTAAQLKGLDFFIHYGHGFARGLQGGPGAQDVSAFELPSHPVIFSGACFGGVCARTFERSLLGNHFGKPEELKPAEVLSLAWLHAGATGLFAALDGDRGEMAGAEWEYFKEHAPPLGAVIGHQYRLIFTSLRESYERFPRYVPGKAKNKSFYSVMLRGQSSRLLLGDPAYRPLKKALTGPTLAVSSTPGEAGAWTARVKVLRRANGPFVNTLPSTAGTPFREVRVYARVPVPEGAAETLAFPRADTGARKTTRLQAKYEVWGGQRYVNLQVESRDFKLAAPGSSITWSFAPAR